MGAKIGFGKQLYKIVFSITCILIVQSYHGFAGTKLTGPTEVCKGETYTYEIDPAFSVGVKPGTDWRITGGRIVSYDRKWATVEWFGTGTHQLRATVYLSNAGGAHWEKVLKIDVSYKNLGTIQSVNLLNSEGKEQAFYCKWDRLSGNLTHTLNTKDYEFSIVWKKYFNGTLEETYTTADPNVTRSLSINKADGKYIYKVQAIETGGCVSNELPIENSFLVKSNALWGINLKSTPPSCHGYRDTEIQLTGIPDYRSTNLYNDSNILTPDANYNLLISQLSGSTQTGYHFQHKFSYTPSLVLNSSNIVLKNQTPPHQTVNGLGEGYYDIQITNPYFCDYERKDYPNGAPLPLELKKPNNSTEDAYGPRHKYSYEQIPLNVYNIKTYNGTDQVFFYIKGGTKPYYINGDNKGNYNYIILTGIPAGQKTYVITDKNNCPLDNSNNPTINLKAPPKFEVNLDKTVTSPVDCHSEDKGDHQNGQAVIHVKGGIGPYKLIYNETEYTTSSSNPNFFNFDKLKEGDHGFTISHYAGDENYSTAYETHNDTFTISQPPQLQVAFSDMVPPICLGGKTGALSLEGSGGNNADYDAANFSINLPDGVNKADDGNKVKYTGLDSIEYVFTIEDSKKCTQTFPYKIQSNPTPANFTIDDVSKITCVDYDDGKVTISGFNGNPDNGNYDFYLDFDELDNSPKVTANSHTYENLVPGTHTIHVADSNDCLNKMNGDPDLYKKSFFIEEPLRIDIETDVTPVALMGEATGKIMISISGGNENYRYEVRDSNDVFITSGVAKVDVSGGKAIVNIDSLKADKYIIFIQDTCNCSNSEEQNGNLWIKEDVTILQPLSALSFTEVVSHVSCKGLSNGKIELFGSGGWEGNGYKYGTDKDSLTHRAVFEGLSAGVYEFFIEDDMGVLYSDTVKVNEPPQLNIAVSNLENVKCFGGSDGSLEVLATGGTAPYEYSLDASEWQSENIIGNLPKGNYTLWARDKNACPAYLDTVINQPELLEVDFITTPSHCGQYDGNITALVRGGVREYNYRWLKNDTLVGEDSVLANIQSAIYNFQLTDQNGCEINSYIGNGSVGGPQITINNITKVSCYGLSDGSVSFTLSQGIPPYQVQIRNENDDTIKTLTCDSAVVYIFDEIQAGDYNIWFMDDENCGNSEKIKIESPDPLKIKLEELSHPVCFGYSNAQIRVSATGGNDNYTYTWSDGKTGNTLSDIPEGEYSVTVSDSKSCFDEAVYSIENPEPLEVDLGEDAYLCEGQEYLFNPGEYKIYEWKKDGKIISSDHEIIIYDQGVYSVWVQDEKGCNAYDTAYVEVSRDLLEANFLMQSEAYENDTVVIIDISWPEPENVEWSFQDGIISTYSEKFMEEFTFREPGTYMVALTSSKAGCVDSLKKEIIVLADTTGNNSGLKQEKEETIVYYNAYPNPGNGAFRLDLELRNKDQVMVMLYSMQQQNYILKQELKGQQFYTLDYHFSNLVPGIYQLVIQAGNERKSIRLVIM